MASDTSDDTLAARWTVYRKEAEQAVKPSGIPWLHNAFYVGAAGAVTLLQNAMARDECPHCAANRLVDEINGVSEMEIAQIDAGERPPLLH